MEPLPLSCEGLLGYCYVNQIPLRDTQPALLVNWCELRGCELSMAVVPFRKGQRKKPDFGNLTWQGI